MDENDEGLSFGEMSTSPSLKALMEEHRPQMLDRAISLVLNEAAPLDLRLRAFASALALSGYNEDDDESEEPEISAEELATRIASVKAKRLRHRREHVRLAVDNSDDTGQTN